MAHVRFVGLGLDLQLFDRLHRRRDRRTVRKVGDRHAFDQVAVAAARAAAQRELRRAGLILIAHELRIAGLDHARRRYRGEEGVAAEDRQVLQRFLIERGGLRRARALDERRFTGDGDLFGEGAYLQQEVEYERLLRADAEALALIRLEAGERHADGIGAGQHAAEGVLADLVGHRGAFRIGVFVDEGDFRAGDHALRIAHRAAQCALVGLCAEGGRGCERKQHAEHDRGRPCLAPVHVDSPADGTRVSGVHALDE